MNDNCRYHTKHDGSWWEHDARGIPLVRVCNKCRKEKLSGYRAEVLTNPQYEMCEDLDDD